MKTLGALVMIVTLAAGCDREPSAKIDAAIDAPVAVDAATDGPAPDAAVRACDGRAYDPCADTANSTDCMPSIECRLFMQQGLTICSPACDASTPCPADESGDAVACNNQGRCRSNAPNTCTR